MSKKPSLLDLLNKTKKIKDISARPANPDKDLVTTPSVDNLPVMQEPYASAPRTRTKAVIYYVEFEDGTAMLAQGEHADIVYRFTREAQEITSNDGSLYYDGPELQKVTRDNARNLIGVS